MLDRSYVNEAVARALGEDIGAGDVTTMCTVPADVRVAASFVAKAGGVLCGVDVARAVFERLDASIEQTYCFKDGDMLAAGDVIGRLTGPAAPILAGERTALNFLQRMSGIATRTRAEAARLAGLKTKIVDTRKTAPGLRAFDKYAVRMGGGGNHRFNLSDGILIKDNHIRAAGGIARAVEAARRGAPHTLRIEVETESLGQVAEALEAGADIIMLDNMDIPAMREAVALVAGRALVEASGNMDRQDLREVAAAGVDYISMGALTHSVQALDISLRFEQASRS